MVYFALVYVIKMLEISVSLFFNMSFPAKKVRKANFTTFNGKFEENLDIYKHDNERSVGRERRL